MAGDKKKTVDELNREAAEEWLNRNDEFLQKEGAFNAAKNGKDLA
jgi:hypothetical protein